MDTTNNVSKLNVTKPKYYHYKILFYIYLNIFIYLIFTLFKYIYITYNFDYKLSDSSYTCQ